MRPIGITSYRAGIAQAKAYRTLRTIISGLLKKHGLTMMHWAILGLIYDAGKKGVSLGELALQLDTKLPFITRNINALENKQLVKRSIGSNDMRVRTVTLNPDHKKTVRMIEKEVRQGLKVTIGSVLSIREAAAYAKLIDKIASIDTQNIKHRL